MTQSDIVLTIPISTNVETSCEICPRNILTNRATILSISPISLANLLIIRPKGFV